MIIEYELTPDDLERYHLYYFRHSPTLRKQTFTTRIALPLIFAVMGVMFGLFLDVLTFFVICLVAAVVLFFVSPYLIEWDFKRRIHKLVLETTQYNMKNCTLSLSPEGVNAKNAVGESKYPWSSIERIETPGIYAYLFTGPASAIIVPRRAFANQSMWDSFLATTQQYRENAKGMNEINITAIQNH